MPGTAANVALINYYARLIHKDVYKKSDVPEDMRDMVLTKLAELGPREPDPVTETPKED